MKGQHEGESEIIAVVGVVVEDSWTRTARIIIIRHTSSAQMQQRVLLLL